VIKTSIHTLSILDFEPGFNRLNRCSGYKLKFLIYYIINLTKIPSPLERVRVRL
jgi:hypothetical protein